MNHQIDEDDQASGSKFRVRGSEKWNAPLLHCLPNSSWPTPRGDGRIGGL